MKNQQARAVRPLMILSLGLVLNAAGRPSDVTVPALELTKASPMLTGEAHAPNDPMLIHAAMLTQMNGTNALLLHTEPQWKLGTNALVTGLIVDGLQPKQTWKMLNPAEPASDKKNPRFVPSQPGSAARAEDNNLADHEADFALLRFSLGSPPKVPKSTP